MRYYESPKGNNNKTSEYIDETKEVSESWTYPKMLRLNHRIFDMRTNEIILEKLNNINHILHPFKK
jgi:hypothetical protein